MLIKNEEGSRRKIIKTAPRIGSFGCDLQAKLHDLLTEKNREAKANMDAASRFMDTGNRSTAPRRDDDLYKVRGAVEICLCTY